MAVHNFEFRLPCFDALLYNSQFKLSGQKVKCHNGIIAQLQLTQDVYKYMSICFYS